MRTTPEPAGPLSFEGVAYYLTGRQAVHVSGATTFEAISVEDWRIWVFADGSFAGI